MAKVSVELSGVHIADYLANEEVKAKATAQQNALEGQLVETLEREQIDGTVTVCALVNVLVGKILSCPVPMVQQLAVSIVVQGLAKNFPHVMAIAVSDGPSTPGAVH